jgi:rhodanese-related sulfurtransferase
VTRDLRRLGILVAASTALGLLVNALSATPVPLASADGPGAWQDLAERVTVSELGTMLTGGRGFLLLDVRGADAFQRSRSPKALNVPAPEFMERYGRPGLASLLKAADGIVVLCDSEACPSADRVARQLKDLGFRDVRVLQGGWKSYRASGLERTGV